MKRASRASQTEPPQRGGVHPGCDVASVTENMLLEKSTDEATSLPELVGTRTGLFLTVQAEPGQRMAPSQSSPLDGLQLGVTPLVAPPAVQKRASRRQRDRGSVLTAAVRRHCAAERRTLVAHVGNATRSGPVLLPSACSPCPSLVPSFPSEPHRMRWHDMAGGSGRTLGAKP